NTAMNSSGRQFLSAVVVCALMLGGANVIVARLTRHSVSRRILADADNFHAAKTIALGNSLVRSGFIAEEYAAAQPGGKSDSAINMAMGASSPAEHLLLLRKALQSESQARLLIYGFYDFQLTDPVTFAFGDLTGNHDLLYYDEPE